MFRFQVPLRERGVRLLGIGFVLVGLVLLAGSGYTIVNTRRFLAVAVVTQGVVVGIARRTDAEGDITYRPIVAFTTAQGQQIEFHSNIGRSSPAYNIDDAVAVVYDPAAPADAELNTTLALWFPTILLGVLGGAFALLGALLAVLGQRWRYRQVRQGSFYREWKLW